MAGGWGGTFFGDKFSNCWHSCGRHVLDVGQVLSLGDVGGTLSLDASSYSGPSFFSASDFPFGTGGLYSSITIIKTYCISLELPLPYRQIWFSPRLPSPIENSKAPGKDYLLTKISFNKQTNKKHPPKQKTFSKPLLCTRYYCLLHEE